MSLFTLIVCAAASAFAAPTQLGHQGRLLDEDGIPLEGLHSLEFQIYDSIEDGTVLWSEIHDVELINGYYSLVLGADELDNPLEDSLFEEDELYLELTVDDDEELEPRQALNAVPYARIAGQATNVKGGVVDASEIRVGGSTVVDSSGTWVSSTPAVDWSELTGIPADFADGEDANTQLSEAEVDAFAGLRALVQLDLSYCEALVNLDGLTSLKHLVSLNLSDCAALTHVDGLAGATALTSLDLGSCGRLVNIDAVSHLEQLEMLDLTGCTALAPAAWQRRFRGRAQCDGLRAEIRGRARPKS